MGGKKFRSDEEVQQAVHEWLRRQPQEFFSRGIDTLRKRWRVCIERNGDYVEKLYSYVPLSFNKLNLKKFLRFSFDSPSYNFAFTIYPTSYLISSFLFFLPS
jgi:hypothetical protein